MTRESDIVEWVKVEPKCAFPGWGTMSPHRFGYPQGSILCHGQVSGHWALGTSTGTALPQYGVCNSICRYLVVPDFHLFAVTHLFRLLSLFSCSRPSTTDYRLLSQAQQNETSEACFAVYLFWLRSLVSSYGPQHPG